MAKVFSCADVVPGCDTTIRAEDEQELMDKVSDHARDAHGMAQVPPEVIDQVRASTRDE